MSISQPGPFFATPARASIPHNLDFAPVPFIWRDPATIPPRPWLYGRHLLRGQVSVTVAPGGVGKSSLSIVEALAMTSGRKLLGEWTEQNLRVWLFNLEDPADELERRIVAAMMHHHVKPAEVDGRLYFDSGRDHPLCVAQQTRNGAEIHTPVFDRLAEAIIERQIDVLIVDPFVSSHRVPENDNGAIDLVVKEWARLAARRNCAIELVHHTRKTNGAEASTEDARGAAALLGAARSGRVLNRMSDQMKAEAGVKDDPGTYFSVDRDKANLAPAGDRLWRRMVSVDLTNGDFVGVAEAWAWPDAFDGISVKDLLAVQRAIEGRDVGSDAQSHDWVGFVVAEVLALIAERDKARIKRLIAAWIRSGALQVVRRQDKKSRKPRPFVDVGEWANE